MVKSLKEALRRARLKLTGTPVEAEEAPLHRDDQVPDGETGVRHTALTPGDKRRLREEAANKVKISYGHASGRRHRNTQTAHQSGWRPIVPKETKVIAESGMRPTTPAAPTRRPPPPAPPPPPSRLITVSKNAMFLLDREAETPAALLANVESAGCATQCHGARTSDEREVVLGLDFGTSSVKVVIGDSALGKAFAVPYCKAMGIKRFLVPSRLYQTGRAFSVEVGTHVFRDLKLSLVANPDDHVLQERVVAFLALLIRRARGWLFTEHSSTYKKTKIVWRFTLGLPAAQHLETKLSRMFEHLGLAAWIVAGSSADVSEALVRKSLDIANQTHSNNLDIEVSVVPEIAAQIYGFVVSNSFDKAAPNIYLMADVGAGTVDSSLFHVKRGKGGRWDFEFFTSVVEPNGVSNLHRYRVNWWHDELGKASAPQRLLDDLAASKWGTDQQRSAPETFLEYFAGVNVKIPGGIKTPDETFFISRVLAQVQGKAFWRAWKDNLLAKENLTNIPFFMCGGGVRMAYYQELARRLASIPGCTWLKAECWVMGVPDDLIAEGVVEDEYDRLSVAYGLSRLEVGKIVKALPKPRIDIPPVHTWRDNYIDKDQC